MYNNINNIMAFIRTLTAILHLLTFQTRKLEQFLLTVSVWL